MDTLAAYDICGMLVGMILLLFGYRFYKPTLFLGGCVGAFSQGSGA